MAVIATHAPAGFLRILWGQGASHKMYKIPDLYKMHEIALSEFRANTAAMLDLVEQGETVRILRHGKPVADLVPVQAEAPVRQPSWKQPFEPVQLPAGALLSEAVLSERDEAPW